MNEPSSELLPMRIYKLDPFTLGIDWNDGMRQKFILKPLRLACTCASCRDEWSGEVKVKDEDIKPNIAPVTLKNVGRYAMHIQWDDGHNTGIYTYDYLKSIGQSV